VILPCSTLAIISVFGITSVGGETQQLADAVERDEDVEHDGRTCGRTGTYYALGDYLRTDKAAL